MQITRPVPAADPVEYTDGRALTEGEEIAGGIFRGIVFPHLDREHVWVQSCLFAGCLFPACVLRGSHFTDVTFRNCDLTQGEFRGTRLRGLSFADSDIRGIRVGEVDSFEIKGLKINALQAVDLVRLLGVEVEE